MKDEDNIALWVGNEPEEIINIEVLEETLKKYTIIPQYLKESLRKDFEARTEPSPLQKMAAKIFKEVLDPQEPFHPY